MIPILLIANLMSILNSFYGTVYTSTMHTSCIMYTTVVGAVVCIILTPALIPVLGIYGACLASVVGQGTVFVIRAVDSRKFITFDAGWRFLAPTLVMLVVQAILTALQVSWWETASAICLLAVTALQGMQVVSLIRASGGFLTLLKRGGKE